MPHDESIHRLRRYAAQKQTQYSSSLYFCYQTL